MLSLGLGLGLTSRGPFSPLHLNPEVFVDWRDTSTLFQDAAGTTAATPTGDPVRLVLDKSGNGNDLTAPSDAARPVYQASGRDIWLQNDEVDDVGVVAASDVSAKMIAVAAQYKTGVETAASNFHTIATDTAGITTTSADRIMLNNSDDQLFDNGFVASVSGAPLIERSYRSLGPSC